MTAPDDGGAGARTALTKASQSAVGLRNDQTRTPSSIVHPFPTPSLERASTTFHLTDLGNAKRLVERFGADLRYVPPQRSWVYWDGRRWALDQTGEIFRRAKETVRLIYAEAAGASSAGERKALAKHAERSEAVGRIRAKIELAKTEPGIPVMPDQFDANPYLLNLLNGTLDLRTGELHPHRQKDLITKLAAVEYDRTARCPMFTRFLAEITANDEELQRFIQKAIGYALTGDTKEQVIFFLWGVGANGKSTFVNVIQDMLNEYALQMTTETLVRKRERSATNDLARLRGARLWWQSK